MQRGEKSPGKLKIEFQKVLRCNRNGDIGSITLFYGSTAWCVIDDILYNISHGHLVPVQ